MKKEIFKTLFEILIVTILLTFSIPTWKEINASTTGLEQKIESNTISLEIYKMTETSPSIINEDYDFKPTNIIVANNSNYNKNGTLLLMYSKLSTLDYKHLYIIINDVSYDLNDLLLSTNKNYYVFELEHINLKKYDNKEFIIGFKTKEDTLFVNLYNKYFDSNLEISEY